MYSIVYININIRIKGVRTYGATHHVRRDKYNGSWNVKRNEYY